MRHTNFSRLMLVAAPLSLLLASGIAQAAQTYSWGDVYGTGACNGEPAVLAVIHRDADDNTHWIAWFPKDHKYDCDYVYWTQIGGATLDTDTDVRGSCQYDDYIAEETGITTICGYNSSPIVTGGHQLSLIGMWGNDVLKGKSAWGLFGGDGDDTLIWWGFGQVLIAGGQGNDKMCGYTNDQQEIYQEDYGEGEDCVFDLNGTYQYLYPYVEKFGSGTPTCGC